MTAIRHTALFHAHERAGASFADHHGWQVPAYFTFAQKEAEQLSKSAALGDMSWMTKLDLKGFGLKTPPAIPDGRAWHLGQEHYLVTCNPAARDSVLAQLQSFSASPDLSLPPPIYITDVTSVSAQFLLAGPQSRDILRKLTSLNVSALQNLGCGQASLAHVHSSVLRDDLPGIPAFHILISREYAESVWEAILHAGHQFHLAPFGIKALEFLGGAA
jgi:glycine cleavage system aminomethyltransferase T